MGPRPAARRPRAVGLSHPVHPAPSTDTAPRNGSQPRDDPRRMAGDLARRVGQGRPGLRGRRGGSPLLRLGGQHGRPRGRGPRQAPFRTSQAPQRLGFDSRLRRARYSTGGSLRHGVPRRGRSGSPRSPKQQLAMSGLEDEHGNRQTPSHHLRMDIDRIYSCAWRRFSSHCQMICWPGSTRKCGHAAIRGANSFRRPPDAPWAGRAATRSLPRWTAVAPPSHRSGRSSPPI